MFQEQNSKSKERLRLKEQRAKYEQIKKDERRQREREKSLKLLIGELFTKHLPDYMLYEEAEMERIVAAAMGSELISGTLKPKYHSDSAGRRGVMWNRKQNHIIRIRKTTLPSSTVLRS